MSAASGFEGLDVVLFENRLAKTLGDLVRVRGGKPILAPAMKEVPLEENAQALDFGRRLLAGEADVVILLTGVGTRVLLDLLSLRHDRESILAALRRTTIVPRGPKPIRVLQEWKVSFALTVPEPNTWKELLRTLDEHQDQVPLRGRRVFVQEYGVSNEPLLEGLAARGARAERVPVYRWTLPDDLGPLREALRRIAEGRADAAVFTTAVQIEHALEVARREGFETDFRRGLAKLVVASVGPDTSDALRVRGIEPDLEPASPKMGPLIALLAERGRDLLERKRGVSCAAETKRAVLTLASEEPAYLQSAFMKACRLEKTDFTPVWLMRQAGRYMKDYRKLREKVAFLDLCKNSDLAAAVTVSAQEALHADAAILFSDILVVAEAMGQTLDYVRGDGPQLQSPVRSAEDVDRLREPDPHETLGFVLEAVRKIRSTLNPGVPLLGFAGAPFTMAAYMIEGGSSRDFARTKEFMRAEPEAWGRLCRKIAAVTGRYLAAQIHAGAQAVQLFDTWAGLLTPAEYEQFAAPHTRLAVSLVPEGSPVIHFGTGTAPFLESFAQTAGTVIGVDARIGLAEAWQRIGPHKALQGNLDPRLLCGGLESLRRGVRELLDQVSGRPGYIFNLGHGVLPETPEENAAALVEMVHTMSASK